MKKTTPCFYSKTRKFRRLLLVVESLGEDEMVVLPGAEGVSLAPLDGVGPKAHFLLEPFTGWPTGCFLETALEKVTCLSSAVA